jgi:hypothetical protein
VIRPSRPRIARILRSNSSISTKLKRSFSCVQTRKDPKLRSIHIFKWRRNQVGSTSGEYAISERHDPKPNDRAALRALARRSETDIVAELRSRPRHARPPPSKATTQRGLALIRKAKAEGERETLVAQLMNRYRLSTEEGVVLMCLAEALLRVPDNATANALIRDKIAGRHWNDGEDEDSPLIVALSARGLSLGSATLMLGAMGSKANPLTLLKSMVRRSGEPVIRQAALAAMKLLGQQFVMGETIDAAVKRADKDKIRARQLRHARRGRAHRRGRARAITTATPTPSRGSARSAKAGRPARQPRHLDQALGAPPALRISAGTTRVVGRSWCRSVIDAREARPAR